MPIHRHSVFSISMTVVVQHQNLFSHGQLGQGHIEEIKEPTPIDYLGGLQIKSIAAGYWHCLALTGFNFP